VFLMKLLCFALFACAFNLLIGSPACCPSAMRPSSAWAGYVCGHALKVGLADRAGPARRHWRRP
jgi:branched-chain amino acid transport system permease protein